MHLGNQSHPVPGGPSNPIRTCETPAAQVGFLTPFQVTQLLLPWARSPGATPLRRGPHALTEDPMEQGHTPGLTPWSTPHSLHTHTHSNHSSPLTAVGVTDVPLLAWPRFLRSSSFTGSFTRTPWYGRGGAGACSGAVAAKRASLVLVSLCRQPPAQGARSPSGSACSPKLCLKVQDHT